MFKSNLIFPATILQVLLFVILSFLCVVGVFYFDAHFLKSYSIGFRMAFETLFFLFLPILLFYGINYKRRTEIYFRVEIPSFKILSVGILVIVSAIFLSKGFNSFFQEKGTIINPYQLDNIWMLCSTCLIGPVLEELYFRIIIQNGLSQSYKPKYSIFITAILFMLVHMPSQYPFAIIVGLFIGFTYYTSNNNIILAISLHLLANNISTFYQFLAFKFGAFPLAVIGLFSFVILIFLLIKYVKNNQNLFYRG